MHQKRKSDYMEEDTVKQLLNDIRKFRDEFKSKGNSYYERISSKDVLFYFLTLFNKLDTRVTKIEMRQKFLFWILPPLVGILGVVGGVLLG